MLARHNQSIRVAALTDVYWNFQYQFHLDEDHPFSRISSIFHTTGRFSLLITRKHSRGKDTINSMKRYC
jgi:hypothetical protein